MDTQELQENRPCTSPICCFDPAERNDHFLDSWFKKCLSCSYQFTFPSLWNICNLLSDLALPRDQEPLTTTKPTLTGSPTSTSLSQALAGKTLSRCNSSIKAVSKPLIGADVTKACVQNLLVFHSEGAGAERSSCNPWQSLSCQLYSNDAELNTKKEEKEGESIRLSNWDL